MEPSGRLHHASSETTLIIARRSRSELIAPFIPFFKSPLCACTSFAILSKRASHRRRFAYVSTQPESLPWDQAQVRKTPAEKNASPIFFQTRLEAYVLPRTTRTYRCYFSIDREVESLRAYPSARRSYPFRYGRGRKCQWVRHQTYPRRRRGRSYPRQVT